MSLRRGQLGPCIFCRFKADGGYLFPIPSKKPYFVPPAAPVSIQTRLSSRDAKRTRLRPRIRRLSSELGQMAMHRDPYPDLPRHRPNRRPPRGESKANSAAPSPWTRTAGEKSLRFLKAEDITDTLSDIVKGLDFAEGDLEHVQGPDFSAAAARELLEDFKRAILSPNDQSAARTGVEHPTLHSLQQIYLKDGMQAVDDNLRLALNDRLFSSRMSPSDIRQLHRIADLGRPTEWNPTTRYLQRKIYLHVGPTNSGKTYEALKRLEAAETGVYAGPLRLLAHEVYTRLNDRGKSCTLVTGDERKAPVGQDEETKLLSCTVEMVPLHTPMDVAVIDEIQMLAHPRRGWAWTDALLGVKAKELHLCGEERTVPLVRQLCAAMGDDLEVRHYKRLSPLHVMSRSLGGNLANLERGDCVVVFSRLRLYAMKDAIERRTGKRCAIIYGSLPSETRAQQARLFNDPDSGYDYLVATDAIGMGLNLAIKRVVFESVDKIADRGRLAFLSIPEIKQIGGRAGRYRVAEQADESSSLVSPITNSSAEEPRDSAKDNADPTTTLGLVTTMEPPDLRVVQHAMRTEAPTLTAAGIVPPSGVITRFAQYFPKGTPFSVILHRLRRISRLHPLFKLCEFNEELHVADLIQSFDQLSMRDRLIFCGAPVNIRNAHAEKVVRALARCVAQQRGGGLLDVAEIDLEALEIESESSKRHLRRLEALHNHLILYLWLSYRYAGVFRDRALAFHVRGMTEQKINDVLVAMSADGKFQAAMQRPRQETIIVRLKQQLLAQHVGESEVPPELAVDALDLDAVDLDTGDLDTGDVDLGPSEPSRSVAPPPPFDSSLSTSSSRDGEAVGDVRP